ncbi:hypothetical protein QVD17_16239 [Tagetes erecta]|uniref:Uncharacterized protein n=1 Tax=Tagetes erecta TaxID=13708 RepID=A0AAD8KR38_TARER|nr:hypothetical protein QVD17_16239 [Tagetes erecta]
MSRCLNSQFAGLGATYKPMLQLTSIGKRQRALEFWLSFFLKFVGLLATCLHIASPRDSNVAITHFTHTKRFITWHILSLSHTHVPFSFIFFTYALITTKFPRSLRHHHPFRSFTNIVSFPQLLPNHFTD